MPPTGARGLNSAASDIYYLYHAMVAHYQRGDDSGLDNYSAKALARVWKAQRFSWWMTTMLHTFPDSIEYDQKLQQTELDYLFSSEAAQRSLAENYVGLPFWEYERRQHAQRFEGWPRARGDVVTQTAGSLIGRPAMDPRAGAHHSLSAHVDDTSPSTALAALATPASEKEAAT